jgi:hypothetical protein
MTKTKHTIVAALVAAAFTTGASAGQIATQPKTTEQSSKLTGTLETSWTSNYTFQGVKLDSNPVFVPKLDLQYNLFNGGTLQASTEQVVGTQGSAWYRTQYNVGLALNVGRFTVTPGYQIVAWPDRDGQTTQYVTGRLSFNDEGLTPVTLRPYALINAKTDSQTGTYYEVGVAPGTTLGKLTIGVPIAIGVGAQGNYTPVDNGATYAFTSAGVALTYPVTDRLSLKGSSVYFNTGSKLPNGSSNFVTNSVGVAVSF